jgi:Tol biopolymer transport system component
LVLILGTAACGGGGGDAAAQASATAPDSERAAALARRNPPPPAPTTDATLALASASASGKAAEGRVCGVSANGGKVAFTSGAGNLVSGDTQFGVDIFVKDFNGNGVTRVVTGSDFNPIVCLALTADANTVVYVAYVTTGGQLSPGAANAEIAILVRNLLTGVQTRVTPPRNTFANVDSYEFSGISDDGLRVAFIAQPTRSCSGYDCTALGPARMLLRDLGTGQLVNLESQVRFTTSQGLANGDARLSPNGRTIAFSSSAPYPELGDTNIKSDVFALDIASGTVGLVNTDAAGRQIAFAGFQGAGPTFGVQDFLANNSKIAFHASFDTDAGASGIYVKDLANGSLTRVLGSVGPLVGYRSLVSFSDDGRKVSYVESNGLGGQLFKSIPRVVDLSTGAIVNAATLSNGTVGNGNVTVSALLSRDGRVAAFDNNATNLLGGVSPLGGAELRAYRKLLP